MTTEIENMEFAQSQPQSTRFQDLFRLKKRSPAVDASVQPVEEVQVSGNEDNDPDFKLHLGPSLVIVIFSNVLMQACIIVIQLSFSSLK